MPSTVEQLSPTRVKITVEVPFADLKPSMDKAYAEIAKSVNIPGFRRGKVPPMVIDQRFGRGVVIQEAFNNSWSQLLRRGDRREQAVARWPSPSSRSPSSRTGT